MKHSLHILFKRLKVLTKSVKLQAIITTENAESKELMKTSPDLQSISHLNPPLYNTFK